MTSYGLRAVGSGWSRFLNWLRNSEKRREREIKQFLIDSAEMVIGHSKRDYLTSAPPGLSVRSGRLRSSISRSDVFVRNKKYSIFIGTNVFYGKYWEEGHYPIWSRNQEQKRPFLAPAFVDKKSAIRARAERIGLRISI